MSGSQGDPVPETDSAKLDQILVQLSTITSRLNAHDQRISRTEKSLAGEDKSHNDGNESGHGTPPRASGHGAPFGSSGGRGFHRTVSSGDDGRSFSRLPKLTFPPYDGETDPLTWLNKCESIFRGLRTAESEKVWMASVHLEGAAAQWYYALERDHGVVSWARFADFVNLRFGPPIRANGLAEIKALTRTGSVEDYQRQFLAFLCRCDDLSISQQIDMFTAGLGEPLKTDVELHSPANLQKAMSLARAYEHRDAASDSSKTSGSRHAARPTLLASKPAATATPAPAPPKGAAGPNRPRFRRAC